MRDRTVLSRDKAASRPGAALVDVDERGARAARRPCALPRSTRARTGDRVTPGASPTPPGHGRASTDVAKTAPGGVGTHRPHSGTTVESTSTSIRIRASTFRSLLCPAVLAAVVPILAAAPAAGADGAGEVAAPVAQRPGGDRHPAMPGRKLHDALASQGPETTGAGTGNGPLYRTRDGVSVAALPEAVATDLGMAPPDPTPARDLVTLDPPPAAIDRERVMLAPNAVREPIKAIPAEVDVNSEKVALGRALFHDPRLSKDDTTACVSCHDLGNGGDDGRRVSIGVEGKPGTINAPTVFNAGLNFSQFWDGRAGTLEQQIDGPVQSPVELGSLWPEVVAKLYAHESYPERFAALYPDGISRENVKNALAEFMKSLTTPNSRFDRWLRGDTSALSVLERRGYALFKHYGCVSCHQGANVGGNMFRVFGVVNDYFKKRGNITDADFGRYNVTGNPDDRHAFKVPSLRMAALTAPYLHDGSAATLRDAVDIMFEYQLGRDAPDEDKDAIVAFIRTLAGDNRELSP